MFIKCCNPECQAPFDHRHGRLVRFSTSPAEGKPSTNQPSIQHFWLCGKCAGIFIFEFESGLSVRIKPRDEESSEELFSRSASAR